MNVLADTALEQC